MVKSSISFLDFHFVFLAITAVLQNFGVDSFIFAVGNSSVVEGVDSLSEVMAHFSLFTRLFLMKNICTSIQKIMTRLKN